jgi:UDP-glucuronate decarboxylase
VVALTGSRSQITYMPLPSDDPQQRQPDISKARAILDWEPQIALDAGLSKTIGYFDQLLSSGAA